MNYGEKILKVLDECIDFVKYGKCLSEETANAYLVYLKNTFDSLKERNNNTEMDLKSQKKLVQKINTLRVQKELEDSKKSKNYFEDKDLEYFGREVEKLLRHPENIVFKDENDNIIEKDITQTDINNFKLCYSNYYSRLADKTDSVDHDLRNKVLWVGKDTKKDLSKKGDSYSLTTKLKNETNPES